MRRRMAVVVVLPGVLVASGVVARAALVQSASAAAPSTTGVVDAPVAAQASDDESPVLEELTGVLERRGNGWYVGDVELGLGARWYREAGPASEDFDGDGTAEAIGEELAGLAGREVTLRVARDDDGSAAVFQINATPYRPEGGRPPWAGGPKKAGEGFVPPGQAKKAGEGFVPPGQAKKAG